RMPWLMVNQRGLAWLSAVPTPVLALEVQRAGMPGPPGAQRVDFLIMFSSVGFCAQPAWIIGQTICLARLCQPPGGLRVHRCSYRRGPLVLKRLHQLIECRNELLDTFVFELLGHYVQINPHFRQSP